MRHTTRIRNAFAIGAACMAISCGGPPAPAASPKKAVEKPLSEPPTPSAPTEAVASEPAPAPAPAAPPEPAPDAPIPDGCYSDAASGTEPPTLHGIAAACVPDMVSLVAGPLVVELAAGQSRDLPFTITNPSKCLRVIAAGGVGVEDLSLVLLDRGGVPLAEDHLNASFALIDAAGPVCLKAPGQYRAVLKMVRGSGKVAVQAWRAK